MKDKMSLGLGKEASAKLNALMAAAKNKGKKPASAPPAARPSTSKGKTPSKVLTQASKDLSVKRVLNKSAAKAEARRKANLIATAKHNKRGGSQLLNQDQVDALIARAEKERKSVIIYNSYAAKGVPYTYTPEGVDPEDNEAYISDEEHDPTYHMTDKEFNEYMDQVWKAKQRQKDPVAEKALQKEIARFRKAEETGELPDRKEEESDSDSSSEDELHGYASEDLPKASDPPAAPPQTSTVPKKKPAPEQPSKTLEEDEFDSESESENDAPAEENVPKTGTARHGSGPPTEQTQEEKQPVVEAQDQKAEAPLKKKRRKVPGGDDDSGPPQKKSSSGTSNPWMALFG
jgi:hypothetical protein